jgi:ABC-type uncharacterized transport system ATPase subunit
MKTGTLRNITVETVHANTIVLHEDELHDIQTIPGVGRWTIERRGTFHVIVLPSNPETSTETHKAVEP